MKSTRQIQKELGDKLAVCGVQFSADVARAILEAVYDMTEDYE